VTGRRRVKVGADHLVVGLAFASLLLLLVDLVLLLAQGNR